jgi:hypothetical protein
MLVYNDKISTFEKYLKKSNIGICKFTYLKMNMELICNLVKKHLESGMCFLGVLFLEFKSLSIFKITSYCTYLR